MFAQHIGIKGKIVDSNRQALEGATVAVYRQDSVLVNGTISDAEGVFELKNLPAGNYRITVSYVGMHPKTSGFQTPRKIWIWEPSH